MAKRFINDVHVNNLDISGTQIFPLPDSETSTVPSVSGRHVILMNMSLGNRFIYGFSGGTPGQVIYVVKLSSANTLQFNYNSTNTSSGNRIVTKSGTNIQLAFYGVQAFLYTGGFWYEI